MTMILRKLCALADEWSVKAWLPRKPIIYSWEEPLTQLASTITDLCREEHAPLFTAIPTNSNTLRTSPAQLRLSTMPSR